MPANKRTNNSDLGKLQVVHHRAEDAERKVVNVFWGLRIEAAVAYERKTRPPPRRPPQAYPFPPYSPFRTRHLRLKAHQISCLSFQQFTLRHKGRTTRMRQLTMLHLMKGQLPTVPSPTRSLETRRTPGNSSKTWQLESLRGYPQPRDRPR